MGVETKMSCQIIVAGSMPASQNNKVRSSNMGVTADIWYVAYTAPRQELLALTNLRQQGFQTYLPLYKTIKKRATKRETTAESGLSLVVHEPMFPRYMFFKPSSHRQSISAVRSTRGVSNIVRFGNQFAVVQSDTLAAIQEQEQLRNHIDLEATVALKPGQHVRMNNVHMQGLEGLVHSVSSKRLVVLMEILGHQTKVKVNRAFVEPI